MYNKGFFFFFVRKTKLLASVRAYSLQLFPFFCLPSGPLLEHITNTEWFTLLQPYTF